MGRIATDGDFGSIVHFRSVQIRLIRSIRVLFLWNLTFHFSPRIIHRQGYTFREPTTITTDVERELIIRSRNGDSQAFREIVLRFQDYAYALACRFLGRGPDAEDIVQESFIRIWMHLGRFDTRKKFSTWFYRIVVNCCLDAVKSPAWKNRAPGTGAGGDRMDALPSGENLEERLDERDTVRLIQRLVQELPPKQRMAFLLRDIEEWDPDDVAKALGLSKGAVKSNLYHARKTLREKILKYQQLDGMP